MGDGCMGLLVNIQYMLTILDNRGDLSFQQTSCTESFSNWRYFRQNTGQLLRGGVEQLFLGDSY